MVAFIVVDHDYKVVALFNTEEQAQHYIENIPYEQVRENHSYYEVETSGEKTYPFSDLGTIRSYGGTA